MYSANSQVIGIVAALGSAASWALCAILLKPIGDNLSSMAMTLVKGAISIVLLAACVALIGYEPMSAQAWLMLIVSGLLGIALSDTLFFEALKELGPVALIVLMMLGQVITVIMAVIFLGERPVMVVWGGIVLILAGVTIVIAPGLSGDHKPVALRGILFGLGSIMSMAVATIVTKRVFAADIEIDSIQAALVRMVAGTVGVFIVGLVTGRLRTWINPFTEHGVILRFSMAILVVTFGGFWLSMVAIKNADVVVANTLISTEPLFVLPLAFFFLKERITARALTGTLIALAGIVMVCVV